MPPPEAWPVARTMQALEVLAHQPLSAPQVAAALKVHPRTARRMLNRLRDEGYLERSDDRSRVYSPTMRIVAVAAKVLERLRVVQRAVPIVGDLHAATSWDAHLMIPSYRSVLCVVHAAEGPQPQVRLGELAPCHCTAAGKLLLGYRQAWRDSVLKAPLERRSSRTTTDPSRLRAEADRVREQGFAVEDRENDADTRAAAAPVVDRSGEVSAALTVSTGQAVPLPDLVSEVVPRAAALSASLAEPDA